jgi:hypothetical protein
MGWGLIGMRVGRLLAAALKAPLWIASVPTSAKSFVDNPVIGSRWLNKLGLHEARMRLAARLGEFRRRRLSRHVDEADRLAFARDGLIVKEDFLPKAQFERLRSEVLDDVWDAREMRQGRTVTRRVFLDFALLRRSKPALAALLSRKDIPALMRYVGATGGQPVISIQCVLANDGGTGDDPQCSVHADTFHSTSKAWFFLHDVGVDDGPPFYVQGSHRLTPNRLAWEREQSLSARHHAMRDHAEGSFRISVDDLRRLGLPSPKSMAVRANTLIIADTFGFHGRTPSPVPTCRIELYATLRRNPFLPWTGIDPLALPFVKARMGTFLTLLDRLGIARMPWRPVGRVRLDAPPQI